MPPPPALALEATSPIRVILRLRPTTTHPQGAPSPCFSFRPGAVSVQARPGASRNALEAHSLEGVTVLPCSATQDECYNAVARELVEGAVVGGVSGCVLAYGQTGSGKTHSMVGAGGGASFEGRGIMPRALAHAFALAEGIASARGSSSGDGGGGGSGAGSSSGDGGAGPAPPTFRMSFVEVLEHGIVDLLARSPDFAGPAGGGEEGAAAARAAIVQPLSAAAAAGAGAGATLAVAEDRSGRTYIPGLLMPRVHSEGEARHLLLEGSTNRAIAEHALNKASSRSHAVLTLYIEQQHLAEGSASASGVAGQPAPPRYVTVASRLHLVDLAGSERVQKTGAEGARLREANFINRSLSALEAVVIALGEVQASQGGGGGGGAGAGSGAAGAAALGALAGAAAPLLPLRDHVPYRSSRLTHFLKGALGGGRGATRLLATLWPEEVHAEECVATLRFAGRMMNLRTAPVKEVMSTRGALDVEERARLVAAHGAEVALLRRELAMHDELCGRRGAGGGGGAAHAPLSAGEARVVEEAMARFLGEEGGGGGGGGGGLTGEGGLALVGGTLATVRHIEAAFEALRRAVWEARGGGWGGGRAGSGSGDAGGGGGGGGGGGAGAVAAGGGGAGAGASSSSSSGSGGSGGSGGPPGNEALETWRLTSPEYAAFVEARKAVKELRGRYSAAALRVNEAKRGVDAALGEAAGAGAAGAAAAAAGGEGAAEGAAAATRAATRLVEAKAAYRARYEEATAARAEAEHAQGHADALAKVVAAAFGAWQARQQQQ